MQTLPKSVKLERIDIDEKITSISGDLLLHAKVIAESLNLQVLHGIVDCLWVKGKWFFFSMDMLEAATGIDAELDP